MPKNKKLGWFKYGILKFNLDGIKKMKKTEFIHTHKGNKKMNSEHYWEALQGEIKRLEDLDKSKTAST